MLSDVDVNDVVVRVLSHMFSGARWQVQVDEDGALPDNVFRVAYDHGHPDPRTVYGIDIELAGPFDSPEAKRLIASVPPTLLEMDAEGHPTGNFGTCSNIQGTGTEHLLFDDRLVSAFAGAEAESGSDAPTSLPALFRFLRFASEHRYEAVSPEISLLCGAPDPGARPLAHLSLDLLAKNKAALILGRNSAAAYHVGPNGRIWDIEPLRTADAGLDVPERMAPLAQVSRDRGCVCVHLDQTPSLYVLVNGICRFRYLNGHWAWLSTRPPAGEVARDEVGLHAMALARNLADQGSGAILTFIDPGRDAQQILERVHHDCVPVLARDETPRGVRGHFNRWLLHHELNIQDAPPELLLNLCRVDGATFINGSTGRIVGYGAIVEASGDPQQGARSTAARFLAESFGAAIKVSEDRTAKLLERGHIERRVW